jgi:hypothetical protein
MPLLSKTILQPIAIGLCVLAAAPGGAQQPMPSRLEIVILRGDGETGNIRRRATVDPAVRVADENGRPVANAMVVFTLPTEGASGDFSGQRTVVVATNDQGEAEAKPLKFNAVPGKVPVHVNASYRGLTARVILTQVTVVPQGEKAGSDRARGHGVLIGVLLAVGAGAGAGVALAMRQSKDQQQGGAPAGGVTPPPAIGITPGTGTIAGGR